MAKTTKKTQAVKKQVADCPPCKPCAPVWPAVVLAIAGTAIIAVSTMSWFERGPVGRDRTKTEDKAGDQKDDQRHDRIQARTPVTVAKSGNVFVFTTPNGLQIDLPSGDGGEIAYEVSARQMIRRTGDAMDAYTVDAYSALLRRWSTVGFANPILHFNMVAESGDWTGEGEDDILTVQRIGQTRGGQSIIVVEGGEREDGLPINAPFVSSLTQAELRAANFQVLRSTLWRSQIIAGEAGGWAWSFLSGRTIDEMSAEELAEAVRILSSIR